MTTTTRIRLIPALIAVAALTLAGCGAKTEGAAQAATSNQEQEVSSEASIDEPTSEAAADPSTDAATGAETEAETGTEEPAASTVVGAGSLDEQSTAWFTEFCGIGKPFDDFFAGMMAIAAAGQGDTATPEALGAAQEGLVTAFTDLGTTMGTVGGNLSAMDPPAVANGEALAANIVKGFTGAGPYFAGVAEKVSALDPSDPATFSAELNTLMNSLDEMGKTLGVSQMDFDPAIKAEIAELPGCQGSMLFNSF